MSGVGGEVCKKGKEVDESGSIDTCLVSWVEKYVRRGGKEGVEVCEM